MAKGIPVLKDQPFRTATQSERLAVA
jgi:hypothetical protein